MKRDFMQLSESKLSEVQGGSRDSYCSGQIAARVIFKRLRGQVILPMDLICQ